MTKGPYVPLSVSYRENDRILGVEPLAELVFVRALAFAKEKFTDGFIGRRQVALLAADLRMSYSVEDSHLVAQLVTAGLWVAVEDGWLIEGWVDWNTIDASRAGTYGNHKRWHVSRGRHDPECGHCVAEGVIDWGESGAITPDDRPDSGPTSPRIAINTAQGNTDARARADALVAEFDQWWSAYPRKEAKKAAVTAYRKARQSASAEQLASGLQRSVNQWRRENRPHDKLPHPTTWLNQARWEDDYQPTANGSAPTDALGNEMVG